MYPEPNNPYSQVIYVQNDAYPSQIWPRGEKPMNPIISTTVVIILIVVGVTIGLLASGTDLLNPWTSVAQVEKITSETDHQNQLYKLEEQKKQAETEAYVRQQKIIEEKQRQQAAADLAYQQQMNALKLQVAATFAQPWMITLLLVLGFTALVLVFVAWMISNSWTNAAYRARQITKARQVERQGRQPQLARPVEMSAAPVGQNHNGHRPYKDLPLGAD